jgi:predicted adenylyl cyclase CyaB
MKNIEVEIRGPLSKKQHDDLVKQFKLEGEFVIDKNRTAICYPDPKTGSLVEDCNIDVRVRNTNGIPELIVKHGKWGSIDESRREYSLIGEKGKFHEMIEMLAVMGFDHGMAIVRLGKIYNYKNVEFSIVEVPNHSYYFEAEIMTEIENKDKALDEIKKICAELNLEFFDEKGFYKYINKLNKESNKEFKFSEFDNNYFKNKFGIQ